MAQMHILKNKQFRWRFLGIEEKAKNNCVSAVNHNRIIALRPNGQKHWISFLFLFFFFLAHSRKESDVKEKKIYIYILKREQETHAIPNKFHKKA